MKKVVVKAKKKPKVVVKVNKQKRDRVTKLHSLRHRLDELEKEIPIHSIYCNDYHHRKHIAVCSVNCVGCRFFSYKRWLCIGINCSQLDRCRSQKKWCTDMRRMKAKTDLYLKLYKEWHLLRNSMKKFQKRIQLLK